VYGPRWCNYDNGTCSIPKPGYPSNFHTRLDCEKGCKPLSDTKFACTKNGCVQSGDGEFRATCRGEDLHGNVTYYSEECESNCKFGNKMHQSFFDNESSLWDHNNYGCAQYPCTKEEIDALKWIRMDKLKEWNVDMGSTLCRPVSAQDLPVGVPNYDNPLDCHNTFGNAGWYCMANPGFCRMDENKNFGSTLQRCHESCTNDSEKYSWNGSECVKDPTSLTGLATCLDNHASYSCSGTPYYKCELQKGGTYGPGQQFTCAKNCHPPGH
jgi:hypothetical protein